MNVERTEKLYVSYSQIAVFRLHLSKPYNAWTDKHVKQGFSWREGSVSFRTIEEAGEHEIQVRTEGTMDLSSDCVRAIRVPFLITQGSPVEIATITEGISIVLKPKRYSLQFECFPIAEGARPKIRFSFGAPLFPEFEVLKFDGPRIPANELALQADPA